MNGLHMRMATKRIQNTHCDRTDLQRKMCTQRNISELLHGAVCMQTVKFRKYTQSRGVTTQHTSPSSILLVWA